MTHCIQYAVVGPSGAIIHHTENLTDDDVRQQASLVYGETIPANTPLERFDRCIACQACTRVAGKLRANLDCPAVQEALQYEVNSPWLPDDDLTQEWLRHLNDFRKESDNPLDESTPPTQ